MLRFNLFPLNCDDYISKELSSKELILEHTFYYKHRKYFKSRVHTRMKYAYGWKKCGSFRLNYCAYTEKKSIIIT